jgi:DNA-binding winged helix-turn-helix (wHTH) protein/Tfp pilus assembly protein PilF
VALDVSRKCGGVPITAVDLATASDFQIGNVLVSPSRRALIGPRGSAEIQPRVMQVLVALAENVQQVVTREALFERCWSGVYVGDDSLNRVVLALRKASAELGGEGFEIETIRKTGYRLSGSFARVPDGIGKAASSLGRRDLVKAAVALVSLAGLGAWAALNSSWDHRFEALLREGHAALAGDDEQFRPDVALRAFQAAADIQPHNPRALGWLALTKSYFAQVAPVKSSAASVADAAEVAQRALAIDPNEPNALMAMFELEGATLDWWRRDRLLRKVIAIDSRNELATGELASLLRAAGMAREASLWNERNIGLLPLSQNALAGRAMLLWTFGMVADADNVINQLRASFPTSRWIWAVRFRLYAFTGRARAAETMLGADPNVLRPGPENDMWRAGLRALNNPSPATIAQARAACFAAARVSGELAGFAMMILSDLGDLNSAFEVANGNLLSRSAIVQAGKPAYGRDPADAMQRINTSWLFAPPCRAMRADARFMPLCRGIGLVEYWRRRGVTPDYVRLDAATPPQS